MERITFDVVGLAHLDVRDNWKEYVAEAVGKQLVLQPQPENVKDPYAVRAREGRLHIGYVAVTDQDVVYQALKGSGLNRLRGVVVESNTEPPVLTVEAEVEKVDWQYDPFMYSMYEGWHYDGLPLMPRKMEQLGDLTDDLTDELESKAANHETLAELTAQLLETNLYDMSREMTRSRYRIERLLAQRSEPEWQEVAHKLRQQKGMLMTHDNRDKVARYLFVDIPHELLNKGLEESHYTYDNRLEELKSQLTSFPYQLYDKFLADPVDFLREVYYKHVPRRYLNQLLSGIILMILKGRVEIERWGREGERDAIKQIHSMGKRTGCQKQNNILTSEAAEVYWRRLEEHGFVDSRHRLIAETTRQQAMYIADKFSIVLKTKTKWKSFETLWGIKNLAQEKWLHLETDNPIPRADVIEKCFR
ncbi:MAG: hypothetical protein J6P55_00795 [Bacteroidaceae bacterium]|nr:hypothetical protein [Bacteroidaceae bacterium]